MSEKKDIIDAYFENWEKPLDRAVSLIKGKNFYFEGILVLTCYIGAFAAMRYPKLKDGEAYIKIVLEYSGMKEFYERIDLNFMYQWSRSKLRDNGKYKDFKNYTEIVEVLKHIYGGEDVKEKIRYVSPSDLATHVLKAKISNFDKKNFYQKLSLFSLAEVLYRYVRCEAVHHSSFGFVVCLEDIGGNGESEDEHIFTGKLLWKTTNNIRNTLWKECMAQSKWPLEL